MIHLFYTRIPFEWTHMTTYVAFDIETTGLDPNRDAIIEIGAVRFNERRIEDEWSTLVNPGRQIPEFITNLTGIDNAMVRGAPSFLDIVHSQLFHSIISTVTPPPVCTAIDS